MKGRSYTKAEIARALAAYDICNECAGKAAKIVDVPKSTIYGWAHDERIVEDEEISRLRNSEKEELERKSYKLADILLGKIMELALAEDATLRDVVGAYKHLIERGADINIAMNQVQQQAQSQGGIIDEDTEDWIKQDEESQQLVEQLLRRKGENIRRKQQD